MGALQVRYMPLALSLNSDCLVTALCITKSTCDRDHSFQTRASQFLYSCPQPLGHVQCMTAGTFALVTQGMGRQTKKKEKTEGDSQLASSAPLRGWNKSLWSCPCAQQCRSTGWQPEGPGNPQDQDQEREGGPHLNCSLTGHPITDPVTAQHPQDRWPQQDLEVLTIQQ